MEAQRVDDDNDQRQVVPKLIVTGRLSGTLDGRPVEILGERGGMTLVTPGLFATIRMRRSLQAGSRNLLRGASIVPLPIRLRMGNLATWDVAPSTHPLLRPFVTT